MQRPACIRIRVRAYGTGDRFRKKEIHRLNRSTILSEAADLKGKFNDTLQRAMELASEKGASSWLTALPLAEFGFSLHKGAFRDAVALRYGWLPPQSPPPAYVIVVPTFPSITASPATKAASPHLGITRFAITPLVYSLKYAMMPMWSHTYNPLPERLLPVPPQSHKTVPVPPQSHKTVRA